MHNSSFLLPKKILIEKRWTNAFVLSFFQFKSTIYMCIFVLFSVLLTCRFVIWFFFIRLSIFFVIIGGTAYHVLFIDARNFLVCLWLIASRAEAVSELITKRKRWMIKAYKKKNIYMCVCHLCEQLRTRAHTQIQIQDRRWEKQSRMVGISEEKKIEEKNWKTEREIIYSIFNFNMKCIISVLY
jgi:hypothetical protein